MKKISMLLSTLVLALALTGCDSQDYEKAKDLYIAGDYAAACELFTELGDYEDSANMAAKCQYIMAEEYWDSGAYADAIALYEALGSYEDSPQKLLACRYDDACARMEQGAYAEARELFAQLGDYEDSAQRAAHMGWYAFHAYVADAGEVEMEDIENCYTVRLTAAEDAIVVEYRYERNYSQAALVAEIGLDPQLVAVSAVSENKILTDFGTAYLSDEAKGAWDISTYKAGDSLTWASYKCPGLILQGQRVSSPVPIVGNAKSPVTMLKNTAAGIAKILNDSGLGLTMADIGFASYEG